MCSFVYAVHEVLTVMFNTKRFEKAIIEILSDLGKSIRFEVSAKFESILMYHLSKSYKK